MGLYVQYGCGFSAPDNWENFDASPTLRFERLPLLGSLYTRNKQRFPANVRYGDIVKGLPVENDSCDGIYCSHVLEHLSFEDLQRALKNTYCILKPGGIFRCVVPDLKVAAEKYIKGFDSNENASLDFMDDVLLGTRNNEKGVSGILKKQFGNSHHLWMWDEKSLAVQLRLAGFKDIRSCSYNDSEDNHFKSVEDERRFENAVALECHK